MGKENAGDVILTRQMCEQLLRNWRVHYEKLSKSNIDQKKSEAEGVLSCIDCLEIVRDVQDDFRPAEKRLRAVIHLEELLKDEEEFLEVMALYPSLKTTLTQWLDGNTDYK